VELWEELEGENQTVHSRHAFCTTKDYNSQDLPLSSSPDKEKQKSKWDFKDETCREEKLRSHGSQRRTAARKDCDR
jgi:hypothetical protein